MPLRTLKEDQKLIKTEDRLSRNLDDEDFTDRINDEIMRLASSKVTDDMVIYRNRPWRYKEKICEEDGIFGEGV